jgi:hypothetical protein
MVETSYVKVTSTSGPYTVAILAIVLSCLFYFFFVPPKRLYSGTNNVPVITSRFGGLGAVGFFANRYNL